ncbi:MAG: tryptophan--tRNA ligase [Deltaproteobacteria bacterium]|nr:tryptophan--tRNA ligase [Deltaproteobacteria bacterium]
MTASEPHEEVGLPKAPGTPTRVLTGVKPTGIPHIGNYLGAIKPAIDLARANETFLFIADLHALTTERDPKKLEEETYSVAATWLACGVDPAKTVFYKQSDVPEVTELAWILSCVTPLGLLNRAHSFKDAQDNKGLSADEINLGVYSYPVLMAADILLYDADVVPVGKDQKQHLEITQELARKLNHSYGPVLRVPRAQIDEKVMTIPGLDGRKMSKSYGNTIELWGTDKELKKKVSSIKTDSTEYGQPLDPDTDTLFALFALFAAPDRVGAVRAQYRAGRKDPSVADASLADPATNYFGWGDAKKALLEQLLDTLGPARQEYARLIADKPHLRKLLLQGAERARTTAQATLARVRQVCGIVR